MWPKVNSAMFGAEPYKFEPTYREKNQHYTEKEKKEALHPNLCV